MRRSPSTSSEAAEVIEFGIPVVDAHLTDAEVTFPTTRAELRDECGDVTIPYDASGNTVTLAEALEGLDDQRFETKNDLLDALHGEFEAYRTAGPSGLVGTVQEYLPF